MLDYDIAIIGGGIVGCSIARELSRYDKSIALFERCSDVSGGTTKANGGAIHAGYDPKPSTLKSKLNVKGCLMYPELSKELGFPFRRTGSMVVGFDDYDKAEIQRLYENGVINGVPGLEIIEGERIFELEPLANPDIKYALYAPSAGISDPYLTTIAYAENAAENGVDFYLSNEVTDIKKIDDSFEIITNKNKNGYKVKWVINAAGIQADEIAQMVNADEYHIVCRHGEMMIFDKDYTVNMTVPLFPVPRPESKGVAVSVKIHGNTSTGSTSTIREKDDVDSYQIGIEQLCKNANRLVPSLDTSKVIKVFAGLRAVVENNNNDFWVKPSNKVKGFFHVAGIQSPGIAAAPALALYVVDMLRNNGVPLTERKDFNPKRQTPIEFNKLTIEEKSKLIKENQLYGNVICRCEMVTEGEIVDAIHRPIKATTVNAIKRRTRSGMGRCQGGFCQSRVVNILARELHIDPQEVLFENEGSELLIGPVKEGN